MSKVVCIVEDNKSINKLFSTLFRKSGYKVVSFLNGSDLVTWVKDNVADVFILDFLLPDMNGSDLLEVIKLNYNNRNSKVILITGLATNDSIAKADINRCDVFLTKPINTKALIGETANLLKEG